jgi:hypothetical protein
MDQIGVLRDKIGRLREEIASIQELNDQFRRAPRSDTLAQIAHGRRQERLQAIQHELLQFAHLGGKVASREQMNEQPLPRLYPLKRKPAA